MNVIAGVWSLQQAAKFATRFNAAVAVSLAVVSDLKISVAARHAIQTNGFLGQSAYGCVCALCGNYRSSPRSLTSRRKHVASAVLRHWCAFWRPCAAEPHGSCAGTVGMQRGEPLRRFPVGCELHRIFVGSVDVGLAVATVRSSSACATLSAIRSVTGRSSVMPAVRAAAEGRCRQFSWQFDVNVLSLRYDAAQSSYLTLC